MSALSKLSRMASKRDASRTTDPPARKPFSTHPPPTPRRSDTTSNLRALFHRRREPTTELVALNDFPPSALSAEARKLAIAFVNTLNTAKVGNFFAWFLFFDLVELPESPATWYGHIDGMEMRGWIALGTYLATATQYGMDIVVLNSICDRLSLSRRVIHRCLVQLSDPQKMAWTQLALAVRESRTMAVGQCETETGCFEELERLEHVRSTLHGLYLVAQRIKPAVDSIHERWRAEAEVRVRGYLMDVIDKWIDHCRAGTPLAKQTTGVQVSEDVQDALHLNFLYEAMQQERPVPLSSDPMRASTSDKATQTEKPLPPLPSTASSEVGSEGTPPVTPTPASRSRV
jgi:hypothetical protein